MRQTVYANYNFCLRNSFLFCTVQLRRVKNKNWVVEDQLNKSLIEKSNLGAKFTEPKEPEKDDSVEILLNEVNKYKQLYENAVRTSSDDGEYKRLLSEVEKCKDQSSRAEEKLFAMLEYEVKYKDAKVNYLYWIALSVLNCSSYRSSKDHLLLIQSHYRRKPKLN